MEKTTTLFLKCDVTKFRIPPLVTQCQTSSTPSDPLTCDVIYGCPLLVFWFCHWERFRTWWYISTILNGTHSRIPNVNRTRMRTLPSSFPIEKNLKRGYITTIWSGTNSRIQIKIGQVCETIFSSIFPFENHSKQGGRLISLLFGIACTR